MKPILLAIVVCLAATPALAHEWAEVPAVQPVAIVQPIYRTPVRTALWRALQPRGYVVTAAPQCKCPNCPCR